MERFTKKFKNFLYENLEDKFKDKIEEKYSSLKKGILLLLDETIQNSDELVNVQNYIHDASEDLDANPLITFIEDSDIYDFYMKYQADIDEICNNNNWFTKIPSKENVFSLYQYIISGSKYAVKQCLKIMEKELF